MSKKTIILDVRQDRELIWIARWRPEDDPISDGVEITHVAAFTYAGAIRKAVWTLNRRTRKEIKSIKRDRKILASRTRVKVEIDNV